MNGEKLPKSHNTDSALDKLTNLPSCVMDQILCRLPIKDAVRTSVLASKWRFKWTTMSDLVFHDEPVNVIDHVLMLHVEAISKFKLKQDRSEPISSTDLDRWILHLSRCNVQKFILKIWRPQGPAYKLHSSLFSFQDLVHLELCGKCHLKLPSTFAGFKKLKKLKLELLDKAQDAFEYETLISSCPILERLTLWCDNHLNIDAPNLLKFEFEGNGMNLINCSKLEEVSIELETYAIGRIKASDSSNLLKLFASMPRIKRLVIEGDSLKYLAVGDIPRQLPNPCTNLGYLNLCTLSDDYVICSIVLCLLRSCPNLQELHMTVAVTLDEFVFGKEFTFWEINGMNCSFNKLQTVNINVHVLDKSNLELIGFILLASPILQKMTIEQSGASEKEELQFARELNRLKRASPNAEVVFSSCDTIYT